MSGCIMVFKHRIYQGGGVSFQLWFWSPGSWSCTSWSSLRVCLRCAGSWPDVTAAAVSAAAVTVAVGNSSRLPQVRGRSRTTSPLTTWRRRYATTPTTVRQEVLSFYFDIHRGVSEAAALQSIIQWKQVICLRIIYWSNVAVNHFCHIWDNNGNIWYVVQSCTFTDGLRLRYRLRGTSEALVKTAHP